jgi:hypothetical protein
MSNLTESDLSNIAQMVAQMLQPTTQSSTVDDDEPQQPENFPADQEMTAQLNSIGSRPHYNWTPSPRLNEYLSLDSDIFRAGALSDTDRTHIIESYPPIATLSYNPPQTLPTAASRMNKAQKREDKLHKQLQYAFSAVFRPLDILAHEIALDSETLNSQRYLHMIKDIRTLMLHNMNLLNSARNNIAFRSVNSTFLAPDSLTSTDYTMDPTDFQTSLTQQHATTKSLKDASNYNKTKKFNTNSLSTNSNPQFFRSGPSSQHGGYNNNNNSTSTSNNNNRQQYNNNRNNSNSNNKMHNTNNPFRQGNNTNNFK